MGPGVADHAAISGYNPEAIVAPSTEAAGAAGAGGAAPWLLPLMLLGTGIASAASKGKKGGSASDMMMPIMMAQMMGYGPGGKGMMGGGTQQKPYMNMSERGVADMSPEPTVASPTKSPASSPTQITFKY